MTNYVIQEQLIMQRKMVIKMLRWLKDNTIHCIARRFIYPGVESIEIARQKGYLDLVKWNKENYLSNYN